MRYLKFDGVLTSFATVISLLGTIVYLTWFAASIDKRVSLLEQHDNSAAQRFDDLRQALNQVNSTQDQSLHEFQVSFDQKLARLDDKMDKVLFILSDKK